MFRENSVKERPFPKLAPYMFRHHIPRPPGPLTWVSTSSLSAFTASFILSFSLSISSFSLQVIVSFSFNTCLGLGLWRILWMSSLKLDEIISHMWKLTHLHWRNDQINLDKMQRAIPKPLKGKGTLGTSWEALWAMEKAPAHLLPWAEHTEIWYNENIHEAWSLRTL